jgi:hypothetical protein
VPSASGEVFVVGVFPHHRSSLCSHTVCDFHTSKVCQSEDVLACFLIYSVILSYLHRLCNGD